MPLCGISYALERPHIRQFLSMSQNSSVLPMMKFGLIENEIFQTVLIFSETKFQHRETLES